MMTYPFSLSAPAMAPWKKQFIGACDERAWAPAAALLSDRLPIGPDDVIANSEFSQPLVMLATEAPGNVVETLREGGLGPLTGSVADWRTEVVGETMGDHLAIVVAGARAKQYLPAHHHLVVGVQLRARHVTHEALITTALTVLAQNIGDTENFIAACRPDLARNPGAISPAVSDIATSVSEPATHYHPQLLVSVVRRMVEAGASDTMLELAIRAVALHARWPSWRALAHEIAQSAEILGPRTVSILEREDELPPGAKTYLEFGVEGLPMPPQCRACRFRLYRDVL